MTHRVFNAFGAAEQTAVANYYVGTNVGFCGNAHRPLHGLEQDWNRSYDPSDGRFLCPDPKSISVGSMNSYTYVANNPIQQYPRPHRHVFGERLQQQQPYDGCKQRRLLEQRVDVHQGRGAGLRKARRTSAMS